MEAEWRDGQNTAGPDNLLPPSIHFVVPVLVVRSKNLNRFSVESIT